MNKKVYIGMSGGVDSSVSAALLQKDGYDVTGVFIKVWQPDWIECSWREERHEAMRVAAHLGIPFVTLDLEKEYKQGVIDYMISEYRSGRTPNPDVMCNKEVKFGGFWKWAKDNGADFIATGHYAQNIDGKMLKGNDINKDQTYFLWTLTKRDLEHILFPVGHLPKVEVRKLAKKFKLPNALKKDSQGLCFIGKVDVKEFLAHYIETKPGNVLNKENKVIGKHNGSLFFTLGERRGFTIDADFKTPKDEAYYVVDKNVEGNTITVSNEKLSDSTNKMINLIKTNWINETLKPDDVVEIRTRYRQDLVQAKIKLVAKHAAVFTILREEDPITPGQSLVAYIGQECVGGGVIE